MRAQQFFDHAAPVIAALKAEGLDRRIYSDVIDDAGNQYVDLVMEGGFAQSVALLGFVYVLEQTGVRFCGLGGVSAGSVTALVLAVVDVPAAARSEKLVEIIANMPMESLVDGIADDDEAARRFLDRMLARPEPATFSFESALVADNFSQMLGLNRGGRILEWLEHTVLGPKGIATTAALRLRMATTPVGWRLRDGTRHRASQLEGANVLPALDPAHDYLCLTSVELASETMVELPRMAGLFWEAPASVNPAIYARCAMSIPLFFKPVRVPLRVRDAAHLQLWESTAGLVADDNMGFPPPEAVFVDGGVLSNFPIDVFHSTYKVPTRPTFGVKLQWDERAHTITGPFKLITQTFNASRHCLDYQFIRKNPDFRQLVAYVDTADYDWLDFQLSDEAKLDLFERGAKTALEFLKGFDWQRYKDTRAKLIEAQLVAVSPPSSGLRG